MNDNNIFSSSIYEALTAFEKTGINLRDFFNASDMAARKAPLRQLCAQSEGWQPEEWLEMEYDFSALFVGPTSPTAATYASAYLDENALLMGQTTLDFRAFLDSLGLSVGMQDCVPDDHISFELELVVMLSACARKSPIYHDALSRLVNGHLNLWFPLFIEKITTHAKTPAIKNVTEHLINWFDELKARVIL